MSETLEETPGSMRPSIQSLTGRGEWEAQAECLKRGGVSGLEFFRLLGCGIFGFELSLFLCLGVFVVVCSDV